MITGMILVVGVEQLVARPDHKGRTELERAAARLLLAMTPGERLQPSPDRFGRQVGGGADRVGLDDLGRRTILIEQHGERELLILDESLGVSLATGPDGNHRHAGVDEGVLFVANLTGSLAAGQSAEVAQEEEDRGPLGPQFSKRVGIAVRIDQFGRRQRFDIK